MATLVLPVAAPKMAGDLGVSLSLIGAYFLFLYSVSMIFALGGGGYIQRYGPLRMSQISLMSSGCGLLLSGLGVVHLLPIAAALIGFGTAISTPASTDILARFSPPKHAPLVFSIKQAGVPVGGILTGLLVPYFAAQFGWRGAFMATGAMCLIMAILLQPLRKAYDTQKQEGYGVSIGRILQMVHRVLTNPRYKELAIAATAYVGVQSIFGAFFVTFMVTALGYDLAFAGQIFAMAQAVSIFGRIFWGWLSSQYILPRTMLALFGIAMSAACAATGMLNPEWKAIAVTAVAIAYAGTAISFHGVLISEIARLAPSEQVAPVTGGVLAFASAGMMIYPALFGVILQVTGSYRYGFIVAAIPALLVGMMFFRRAQPEQPTL